MYAMRLFSIIIAFACLALVATAAREKNGDGKTSCVPVRTSAGDSLAFGAGEKLTFTVHYKWGPSILTWEPEP